MTAADILRERARKMAEAAKYMPNELDVQATDMLAVAAEWRAVAELMDACDDLDRLPDALAALERLITGESDADR